MKVKVKVIIDKDVTDWASEESWKGMDDDQVIEFLNEDLLDLMDGSKWTITRKD